MEIRVESLLEGAKRAEGTVVIVDVYRAFTTASVALSRGVEKIVFVADPDDALVLRNQGIVDLCVGEVGGIPPDGYDFGNSPFEMAQAAIQGKSMAQSTRAGTVGVSAAEGADVIYGASLVNARATVEHILASAPKVVTVVAMGLAGKVRTDEDEQCALYLRNLLWGREPDRDSVKRLIRIGRENDKFMDPALPHFHPEDVAFALNINSIAEPVRIKKEDGMLVARPARLG